MDASQRRCMSCLHVERQNAKFCSECGYNLSQNIASTNTSNNTFKTILLTFCATIGIIGLAVGTYYLGANNRAHETTASTSNINSNFVSPTNSIPANSANAPTNAISTFAPTNLNTNVNTNTNAAAKIVKKTDANVNSLSADKKRALSEGAEYGWSYLTQTNDSMTGYYYFYRSDSIKFANTGVEVWAKKYPMFPRGVAKQYELSIPVDYVIEKIRFYCKNDTFYVMDQTFFDASGSSIPNKQGYRTYQQVVPGTITESLRDKVCTEENQKTN